jgi:hypothetical protein
MNPTRLLASISLVATLTAAPSVQSQPPAAGWQHTLDAVALHQWASDTDDGGTVSIDAWSLQLGARYGLGEALRLGLTGAYGERRYSFGGSAGLAGQRPWSRVRQVKLSGSASWKADARWDIFAVPTLRWAAEADAALNDGLIAGLLAAASYRFSDRLTIGPGIGVFSELEDGVDWFPILAVDWRISDRLSLRTGRGLGASRGPGLTLRWEANERWSFSLGSRYEKERFRLDDRGIAPGGIGQETSIPVYLGATRSLGGFGSVSIFAGAEFDGALRLENAHGDLIDRTDYETAPFGGATLDLRF